MTVLVWISMAFVFGLLVRLIGLPPLVGFLLAGFALQSMGVKEGVETLHHIGELGVTLLLFSIGLKLRVRTLLRREVWGVASSHMLVTVLLFGLTFYGLSVAGVSLFAGLDLSLCLLLGFALSFSSTVFAVKVLEDKNESSSRHGRVAIGILIIQDIAAVIFLALSVGKIPTPWAVVVLLGLVLLRPVILWLMTRSGHGELLLLFGLILALVGAQGFELVHIKGDLGAIVLGMLISQHPKTSELSHTLMGFKDLFLVGFFLHIGLSATPTVEAVAIALLLTLAVALKTVLYFGLLTRFHLRARNSVLASLSLSNYSEFGLIVGAIAVNNGWLGAEWLVVIAIALSLSFIVASPLNGASHQIYTRFHDVCKSFETRTYLPDDEPIDPGNARIAIIGMGRIGTGAYEVMQQRFGDVVIGLDSDPLIVSDHQKAGRRVILGDATDADFWEKVPQNEIQLVMLASSSYPQNLEITERLKAHDPNMRIAANAKYADQEALLRQSGVDDVFNIYATAGAVFAEHVSETLFDQQGQPSTTTDG